MTTIEERLRADLPALADALLASGVLAPDTLPSGVLLAGDEAATGGRAPMRPRPAAMYREVTRRRVLVGAAAAVAAGAATVPFVRRRGGSDRTRTDTTPTAPSPGTWTVMATAPIDPRPYAVTVWTGEEAVFWAGSTLSRTVAYSDGARYDPATNSWQAMIVPGWGHPALSTAFFDGEIYTVAKSHGTRIEPISGRWQELPSIDGVVLATMVATADGIWGLGTTAGPTIGQPALAIAEYHPADDRWTPRPPWDVPAELAAVVDGFVNLETAALWTGTDLVVWNRSGAAAYDPGVGEWRALPPLPAEVAAAVATDLGLVMVTSDADAVSIQLRTATGWEPRARVRIDEPSTLTVAGAGEWIMLFARVQSPTLVHLPTGAVHVAADGPISGVQAPNTAWTGQQLVIWGGQPDDWLGTVGAIWTPPAR